MKKSISYFLVVCLLLVCFSTSVLAQKKNKLVGSWQAVVTPTSIPIPAFPGMLTFTSDGGVIETDAGPPNTKLFTAGHGEWERIQDRQYAISYVQLRYDETGKFEGFIKVRITANFNDKMDEFNGQLAVEVTDPNSVVLLSGKGDVKAKRMKVERISPQVNF